MDMLELECPNCKELLELDLGFAGGVCRCSNCSVLMTVPENPTAEQAEKLSRPDVPIGSIATNEEDTDPAATLSQATAFEAGTYTTESGRSVMIDSDTYIPTARKKKRPAVRATVALVFLLLMAGVIAVCAFAMMVLIHGTPEEEWEPGTQDILKHYDESKNPFNIEKPNLLGLPIGSRTVAVLDTASTGRSWLGVAKDMILSGTDHELTGMRFQVILCSDEGTSVFPDEPTAMIDLNQSNFKDFLRGALAMGQPDLTTAIDRAVNGEPRQIVLITGRDLTENTVVAIGKILEISPETQFDVISIDASPSAAVKNLVTRHNGLCQTLTSQQLNHWHGEILY